MAVRVTAPVNPVGRPSVSPIQVMVRMKLAMILHTLRDSRTAGWTYIGTAVGLALAAGTVWAAFVDVNLVAVGMAFWMLGWMIGPLVSNSSDPLRPEYFAGVSLSPRRLATALLAGSLVGFAPLVSLIAVISLVIVGVRLGPAAAVIAIPALAAQLLLFVSISKLVVALYGLLLRVRIGAALSGVVVGFILAFTAQGWALIAAFVSNDVATTLGDWARAMPSGWALVALEAAARGDWGMATGALVGMIILSAAAVVGWSALLHRRTASTIFRIRPHRLLRGTTAAEATLGKELRSMTRDLLYSNRLIFSASYGLFFCLMPLAVGWKGMLPWAAPIFVLMAASMSTNLYGNDGTSLWMIISTPGAERLDVRIRQTVFLIMVGPLAVIMAVITTALADSPTQWPFVVAALPALLGGGAGLTVLLSVFTATPTTDPHKRTSNPLDTGGDAEASGTVYVGLMGGIVVAAPALIAVWAFGWWGVLVGVATGVLGWWWMGRAAGRRLETHGAELLTVLRHGRSTGAGGQARDPFSSLPKRKQRLVGICLGLGSIPLFPQGIVPMIFLLTGNTTKVWFLAMYQPHPWNWVVATAMVLLGLGMYGYAIATYAKATKTSSPSLEPVSP